MQLIDPVAVRYVMVVAFGMVTHVCLSQDELEELRTICPGLSEGEEVCGENLRPDTLSYIYRSPDWVQHEYNTTWTRLSEFHRLLTQPLF
jgi:hypothetical protein